MSFIATRPVRYFQGQVLGISEFEDEQSYHAEARRRHHVSHHDWGIVNGLELRVHGKKVTVDPGLAIDGYGRTVLLATRSSFDHIDPESMEAFERPQVCCWIEYNRILPRDDQGRPDSRWDETPRLTLRYQRSDDDNREPPARPDTEIAKPINSWEPLPIDPRWRWPVYLGCIRLACDQPEGKSQRHMSADLRARRFVGLRASSVRSPGRKVALNLGDQDPEGPCFSVGFSVEDGGTKGTVDALSSDPSFLVARASGLTVNHDAKVQGKLGLEGGPLVFHGPSTLPDKPAWRCYRYVDPADGAEELRLEIGPEDGPTDEIEASSVPTKNGIIFGHTAVDGGKFEPLMSVLADRTVTIHGDLHVTGKINPAYDPLGELALTEAAEQTLKSAGIAAESGNLARQAATSAADQTEGPPEDQKMPPEQQTAPPPKNLLQKAIGVIKDAKKTPLAIAFGLGAAASGLGITYLPQMTAWLALPPEWMQLIGDGLAKIATWLQDLSAYFQGNDAGSQVGDADSENN